MSYGGGAAASTEEAESTRKKERSAGNSLIVRAVTHGGYSLVKAMLPVFGQCELKRQAGPDQESAQKRTFGKKVRSESFGGLQVNYFLAAVSLRNSTAPVSRS